MSLPINISNLNYTTTNIGRNLKQTKIYHLWEFCINDEYHKVEIFHSKMSSKVKLIVDNQLLSENNTKEFRFAFKLRGLYCLVYQSKTYKFILTINDRSFDALKFESKNIQKRSQSKDVNSLIASSRFKELSFNCFCSGIIRYA